MDERARENLRRRLDERESEFRRRLDAIREGSLGQTQGESIQELSTYDNHPADIGTTMQLRSQDLAFRDGASHGLERVQAARERLDAGTYGTCRYCGRAIAQERLEAVPEADACVACEETHGDPGNARDRDRGGRPAEEQSISPPFARTFTDGTDNVAYDGEDAWQDVARYGTSETPSDVPSPDPEMQTYPHVFVDAGERRGGVEDVDLLADADAPVLGYDDGALAEGDENVDETEAAVDRDPTIPRAGSSRRNRPKP